MADILKKAKQEHYGVAAPNVFNDKTIEAAFQTSAEFKAPVILDGAGCHGIEELAYISRFYERRYPEACVALNLDHGGAYEEIMLAIRSGFSSVMVDRSELPYDENVREVKEIVKAAHAVGVSVEAELGLTDKKEALSFIEETGVDCLAVAVGTSHGVYKGTPHLEFELLKELSESIEIPLVLHGGSGTGDENLKKAVETGIQKVNLFTDLSAEGVVSLKSYLGVNFDHIPKDAEKGEFGNLNANLYDAIVEGTKGWKTALKHYVELFGGTDRL